MCVDFTVHLEHFSNQTTKLIEKSHINVLKHSKKIVILKKIKKILFGHFQKSVFLNGVTHLNWLSSLAVNTKIYNKKLLLHILNQI